MTNEVAKVLASALEPLYNQKLITVLCGLVKMVSQEKANATVRFPVPYDYDSPTFQMDNSALVPNQEQRAIVYFEGNDSDITSFTQNKSMGRTNLKLVCWYNSALFQHPDGESIHPVLLSKIMGLIGKARPGQDSVLQGVSIDATRVYDSAATLFSRYSYKSERGQYLQNPYFALGIDFTVTYQINHGCTADLLPIQADACC